MGVVHHSYIQPGSQRVPVGGVRNPPVDFGLGVGGPPVGVGVRQGVGHPYEAVLLFPEGPLGGGVGGEGVGGRGPVN